MKLAGIIAVVGTALVAVASILQFVALSTSSWTVVSNTSVPFSIGLWQLCIPSLKVCHYYGDFNGSIMEGISTEVRTCEAFSILGMLFIMATFAVAMFQIVLSYAGDDLSRVVNFIPLATAVVALIAVLVSVILWSAKIHQYLLKKTLGHNKNQLLPEETDMSLDYSFVLSIVAGILDLIGAVIFFLGANQAVAS